MPPKTSVIRKTIVVTAVLWEGHDSEDASRELESCSSEASIPARRPLRSSSSALSAADVDLVCEWGNIVEEVMVSLWARWSRKGNGMLLCGGSVMLTNITIRGK